MAKYTTITVKRDILHMLENIKEELGATSLGEAIISLIKIYKEYKSLMFAREVEAARREGLNDVKEVVNKVRGAKWAKL